MQDKTIVPELAIQTCNSLQAQIEELAMVYDAMEIEFHQINSVCGKLQELVGPVMPNNPNIIQAATKRIIQLHEEIGNLKYALSKLKLPSEILTKIAQAKSAAEINKIIEVFT